MAQESNFYRVYKLAHQDRIVFLKNFALSGAVFIFFLSASFLTIGFIKNPTAGQGSGLLILWFFGLSLLPIFFLTSSGRDFFLGIFLLSFSPVFPLIFLKKADIYVLPVIAIIFICLMISGLKMKFEAGSLVSLKWLRIINRGSFLLSFILVLAVSYLVYQLYQSKEVASFDRFLEKDNFFSVISVVMPSGSIDEMIGKIIKQQTEQAGASQKIFEQQIAGQVKNEFSKMLGFEITGKENLPTLIASFIKNKWETFNPLTRGGLIGAIALFAFSLLTIINVVFSFLIIILSWIFLEILLALKFLKIKRVGVEKEELVIG